MQGILTSDLIAALEAVGVEAPAASNALPALTEAARWHDLSLRIESGAVSRRQHAPSYRAVVWPSICGQRESQAAQRLATRGHGATGAEALAWALLDALKIMRAAQARELTAA
ncbi:MAG: hypothetical protein R2853_18755 [Thermomicrobiales bacterium]|nr:hypothetical protein [Thermomicrobiales bacterium]